MGSKPCLTGGVSTKMMGGGQNWREIVKNIVAHRPELDLRTFCKPSEAHLWHATAVLRALWTGVNVFG